MEKEDPEQKQFFVHTLNWEQDWADILVNKIVSRNIDPLNTIYIIVAISSVLPDHQKNFANLFNYLDVTSGERIQWIAIGTQPQRLCSPVENDINLFDEFSVIKFLSELKEKGKLTSLPSGAIIIMRCQHYGEELHFDVDSYITLDEKSMDHVSFRELCIEISPFGHNEEIIDLLQEIRTAVSKRKNIQAFKIVTSFLPKIKELNFLT